MARVRATLVALAWSASLVPVLLGGPAPATAEDAPNVVWTAKAEPDRVAPGRSGVLVVSGAIRKTLHVYADAKKFTVTPTAVEGVAYGKVESSKPKHWTDPTDPSEPPIDVWFDHVEVRVPFTLTESATLPLRVSASIKWSGCDEESCYSPTTTTPPPGADIRAPEAVLPASAGAAAPPTGPGGTEPKGSSPDSSPATSPVPPAMAVEPPPVAPQPALPATAPRSFRASASLKTEHASVTVTASEREFAVTFEPAAGHHLYPIGHTGGEIPVSVRGDGAGVTWREAIAPATTETEIRDAYEVRLPYSAASAAVTPLAVLVSWQACLDPGPDGSGMCFSPEPAHRFTLDRSGATPSIAEALDLGPRASAPSPPTSPAPSAAAHVPATGLLFPVVSEGSAPDEEETAPRNFLLMILASLGIGLGLSLTPCVLPLIPITVSLIGGGSPNVSRARLTFMIACYVLGLSMAFGVMGLAAAKAGASFAAAFKHPIVLRSIVGVLLALSLGMFGVYELQPPAWAQRLQGGAKGGNPIGAFLLGAMGALIASPCTGPFIAALVIETAKEGNALRGFLGFFSIGLGMGIVFFAAGSLNLLLKPGPWMVWVRYGFGLLIVVAALYYLRSADQVGTYGLIAIGFGMATLIAVGIGHHLHAKEGEERIAAYARGVKVALVTVVFTGVLALTMRDRASAMTWTSVTSREQVVAEVESAKQERQWTVVDVWATWCGNCKKFDPLIEDVEELKQGFQRLRRLRMDLTEYPSWEASLREGLDIRPEVQPTFVFIDPKGRIRHDLRLEGWSGRDATTKKLKERLDAIAGTGEAKR